VSQAQPAPTDELGFNGNDALATLLEQCEADRGRRFRS
jgi:hypothetical protein